MLDSVLPSWNRGKKPGFWKSKFGDHPDLKGENWGLLTLYCKLFVTFSMTFRLPSIGANQNQSLNRNRVLSALTCLKPEHLCTHFTIYNSVLTLHVNGLPGTSCPLKRSSTVWFWASRGVKLIAYVCWPWACAEVGTRPPLTVTSRFPGPAWEVSTAESRD